MNARDKAPLNATEDYLECTSIALSYLSRISSYYSFLTDGAPQQLSISVPGDIKGFYMAWERFGRLKWADLFEDIIKMCEDGFRIGKSLAAEINNKNFYRKADDDLNNMRYFRSQ